jgi:hypothetical protein
VIVRDGTSNLYYQPKGESAENLRFMTIIDKQFWTCLGMGRATWRVTCYGRDINVYGTECGV